MSTDPRLEEPSALAFSRQDIRAGKASPVIRGLVDIIDSQKRRLDALAAADKAATITTVEELDALPVGSVILSDTYQYSLTTPNYPVSFQKLYGGLWYRGGRSSNTHESYILPARVILRGTE